MSAPEEAERALVAKLREHHRRTNRRIRELQEEALGRRARRPPGEWDLVTVMGWALVVLAACFAAFTLVALTMALFGREIC